ncbi:MAG: methylmalonyl Co-A mutase-associated GTPase MeaB [Candidatus Eisenbacteria bacterium]
MFSTEDLLKRFTEGDRIALSKIITLVENHETSFPDVLDRLYPRTGKAYRIGVTGPPGAGKSTLVSGLVQRVRADDKLVGVIAVDPSSPFTGGALLGDRIRMQDIGIDPGVFVRSMATRGSLGGLAEAAGDVADVMDAFGEDVIITETVGVGQCELDIAEACYTTVVVIVPESGDAIQAMKAGLMEIADVIAINKADREGADRIARQTQAMLELRGEGNGWSPPVVCTIASQGDGVSELYEEIEKHRAFQTESGLLKKHRRGNVEATVRAIVESEIHRKVWGEQSLNRLHTLVDEVMGGKRTPRQASAEILSMIDGR